MGQEFRLTLVLGPRATVAISAAYADGDIHGTYSLGDTGANRDYIFTWRAAPTPGDGAVLIAASDDGRKNSGTKSIPFRVMEVGKRC